MRTASEISELRGRVSLADRDLRGTYARQSRQEWAASRVSAGWSGRLVRAAVSAGALARVRAAADLPGVVRSSRLRAAVEALSIIDSGLGEEIAVPRFLRDDT